jgi:hypothetical protein
MRSHACIGTKAPKRRRQVPIRDAIQIARHARRSKAMHCHKHSSMLRPAVQRSCAVQHHGTPPRQVWDPRAQPGCARLRAHSRPCATHAHHSCQAPQPPFLRTARHAVPSGAPRAALSSCRALRQGPRTPRVLRWPVGTTSHAPGAHVGNYVRLGPRGSAQCRPFSKRYCSAWRSSGVSSAKALSGSDSNDCWPPWRWPWPCGARHKGRTRGCFAGCSLTAPLNHPSTTPQPPLCWL